ncbi:MAG: acetyl-CoA carboxylase biotin carboxyl carrier protein [Bryobacteraceae bacterium]
MTVDEIRELINLASETGIAELEVQRGDNRVRIRRSIGVTQEYVWGPPPGGIRADAPVPAVSPAGASPAPAKEASKEPGVDPNLILVRSPIVGTFYESSAPGAPPFVRVGERVQPGKVLCIIESMKLMNEIEAEVSGTIESKLVMNGQPVEYGEALFAIRSH